MKQSKYFSAFALLMLLSAQSAFAEEKGLMSFFSKKDKPSPSANTESSKGAKTSSTSAVAAVDPSVGNLAALNMRMANNKTMTDEEKDSLAKAALGKFPKGADLKAPAYEKQMLVFEGIANDPNMKVAEKKAAIESQLTGQANEAAAVEPVAAMPVVKESEKSAAETIKDTTEPMEAEAVKEAVETPAPAVSAPESIVPPPVKAVEEKTVSAAKEVKVKKSASNFSKSFAKKTDA